MKPKKFSVYKVVDIMLWNLILFLPLIFYFVYLLKGESTLTFFNFVSTNLGLTFNENSTVFVGIRNLFTDGYGYFDLFSNMGFALHFLVWFFFVEWAHLLMDILIALPRLFHEWTDKFTSME